MVQYVGDARGYTSHVGVDTGWALAMQGAVPETHMKGLSGTIVEGHSLSLIFSPSLNVFLSRSLFLILVYDGLIDFWNKYRPLQIVCFHEDDAMDLSQIGSQIHRMRA